MLIRGYSAAGLSWLEHFRVKCYKSFVRKLYENKVQCYLATRPEVEGFIHQGFVLPKVKSLTVLSFVAS